MTSATPEDARNFAREALAGQTDKAGAPLTAHAERMAATLESETAQQVAYLHDVLEDSDVTRGELRRHFSAEVVDAVEVLTRQGGGRFIASTSSEWLTQERSRAA